MVKLNTQENKKVNVELNNDLFPELEILDPTEIAKRLSAQGMIEAQKRNIGEGGAEKKREIKRNSATTIEGWDALPPDGYDGEKYLTLSGDDKKVRVKKERVESNDKSKPVSVDLLPKTQGDFLAKIGGKEKDMPTVRANINKMLGKDDKEKSQKLGELNNKKEALQQRINEFSEGSEYQTIKEQGEEYRDILRKFEKQELSLSGDEITKLNTQITNYNTKAKELNTKLTDLETEIKTYNEDGKKIINEINEQSNVNNNKNNELNTYINNLNNQAGSKLKELLNDKDKFQKFWENHKNTPTNEEIETYIKDLIPSTGGGDVQEYLTALSPDIISFLIQKKQDINYGENPNINYEDGDLKINGNKKEKLEDLDKIEGVANHLIIEYERPSLSYDAIKQLNLKPVTKDSLSATEQDELKFLDRIKDLHPLDKIYKGGDYIVFMSRNSGTAKVDSQDWGYVRNTKTNYRNLFQPKKFFVHEKNNIDVHGRPMFQCEGRDENRADECYHNNYVITDFEVTGENGQKKKNIMKEKYDTAKKNNLKPENELKNKGSVMVEVIDHYDVNHGDLKKLEPYEKFVGAFLMDIEHYTSEDNEFFQREMNKITESNKKKKQKYLDVYKQPVTKERQMKLQSGIFFMGSREYEKNVVLLQDEMNKCQEKLNESGLKQKDKNNLEQKRGKLDKLKKLYDNYHNDSETIKKIMFDDPTKSVQQYAERLTNTAGAIEQQTKEIKKNYSLPLIPFSAINKIDGIYGSGTNANKRHEQYIYEYIIPVKQTETKFTVETPQLSLQTNEELPFELLSQELKGLNELPTINTGSTAKETINSRGLAAHPAETIVEGEPYYKDRNWLTSFLSRDPEKDTKISQSKFLTMLTKTNRFNRHLVHEEGNHLLGEDKELTKADNDAVGKLFATFEKLGDNRELLKALMMCLNKNITNFDNISNEHPELYKVLYNSKIGREYVSFKTYDTPQKFEKRVEKILPGITLSKLTKEEYDTAKQDPKRITLPLAFTKNNQQEDCYYEFVDQSGSIKSISIDTDGVDIQLKDANVKRGELTTIYKETGLRDYVDSGLLTHNKDYYYTQRVLLLLQGAPGYGSVNELIKANWVNTIKKDGENGWGKYAKEFTSNNVLDTFYPESDVEASEKRKEYPNASLIQYLYDRGQGRDQAGEAAREATAKYRSVVDIIKTKEGWSDFGKICFLIEDKDFNGALNYDDAVGVHTGHQVQYLLRSAIEYFNTAGRNELKENETPEEKVVANLVEYVKKQYGPTITSPTREKNPREKDNTSAYDKKLTSEPPATMPDLLDWMCDNAYNTMILQEAIYNCSINPEYIFREGENAAKKRQEVDKFRLATETGQSLNEEDLKELQAGVEDLLKKSEFFDENGKPKNGVGQFLEQSKDALAPQLAALLINRLGVQKNEAGKREFSNKSVGEDIVKVSGASLGTSFTLGELIGNDSLDLNLGIAFANGKPAFGIGLGWSKNFLDYVNSNYQLKGSLYANAALDPSFTALLRGADLHARINVDDAIKEGEGSNHYINFGPNISMIGFIPSRGFQVGREKDDLAAVEQSTSYIAENIGSTVEKVIENYKTNDISSIETELNNLRPDVKKKRKEWIMQKAARNLFQACRAFDTGEERDEETKQTIKQRITDRYVNQWSNQAKAGLIDQGREFSGVSAGIQFIGGMPVGSGALNISKYNNAVYSDAPKDVLETLKREATGKGNDKVEFDSREGRVNYMNQCLAYSFREGLQTLPENAKMTIENGKLAIPYRLLTHGHGRRIGFAMDKTPIATTNWNGRLEDQDEDFIENKAKLYFPLDIDYGRYNVNYVGGIGYLLTIGSDKNQFDPNQKININEIIINDSMLSGELPNSISNGATGAETDDNLPERESHLGPEGNNETEIEKVEKIIEFDNSILSQLQFDEEEKNKDFLMLLGYIDNMYGETGPYMTFKTTPNIENLINVLEPIVDETKRNIDITTLINNASTDHEVQKNLREWMGTYKEQIDTIISTLKSQKTSPSNKQKIIDRMQQAFARIPEWKLNTKESLIKTVKSHKNIPEAIKKFDFDQLLKNLPEKLQRKVDPSLIGYSAFYRKGTDPAVRATSLGGTTILEQEQGIDRDSIIVEKEISASDKDYQEAQDLLFGEGKDKKGKYMGLKSELDVQRRIDLASRISQLIEEHTGKESVIIPDDPAKPGENLCRILKGEKFDIADDGTVILNPEGKNSLQVAMYVYLLGDCANESIGFRITGMTLEVEKKPEKTEEPTPEPEEKPTGKFSVHMNNYTTQYVTSLNKKNRAIGVSFYHKSEEMSKAETDPGVGGAPEPGTKTPGLQKVGGRKGSDDHVGGR